MQHSKEITAVIVALQEMVETFDHPGLRGLVLNAKRHGWTEADVDHQVRTCRAAKAALEALPALEARQLALL